MVGCTLPPNSRCGGDAKRHRLHAGHLRGDHVHDHAGRVDGLPAGDVQPDAPHRTVPLHDAGAVAQGRHGGRGQLGGAGLTHARNGFLQRGSDLGVESEDGGGNLLRAHPHAGRTDPVEPLGLVEQGRLAAHPHIGDQLFGNRRGDRDVGSGTRYQGE